MFAIISAFIQIEKHQLFTAFLNRNSQILHCYFTLKPLFIFLFSLILLFVIFRLNCGHFFPPTPEQSVFFLLTFSFSYLYTHNSHFLSLLFHITPKQPQKSALELPFGRPVYFLTFPEILSHRGAFVVAF